MKKIQKISGLLLVLFVMTVGECASKMRIEENPTALLSLSLTVNKTTLNKDTNTTLKVEATYSDNTTKDVTEQVEWLIDNRDAVQIQSHILIAKQDKPVRLLAKVGKKVSNAVTLSIYWEIDGYRLPSEPDPTENDATLGGVDANSNGVRDDVERKIYAEYPVKLQRALLMDEAKYFQKVMLIPVDKARKLKQEGTKNIDCKIFLRRIDKDIKSDDFDWITFLENNTINTKQRVRKYLDYNLALSGGVYGSSPSDWNRGACSEEIQKVLEEMGL
jgi:hypothetical protein